MGRPKVGGPPPPPPPPLLHQQQLVAVATPKAHQEAAAPTPSSTSATDQDISSFKFLKISKSPGLLYSLVVFPPDFCGSQCRTERAH